MNWSAKTRGASGSRVEVDHRLRGVRGAVGPAGRLRGRLRHRRPVRLDRLRGAPRHLRVVGDQRVGARLRRRLHRGALVERERDDLEPGGVGLGDQLGADRPLRRDPVEAAGRRRPGTAMALDALQGQIGRLGGVEVGIVLERLQVAGQEALQDQVAGREARLLDLLRDPERELRRRAGIEVRPRVVVDLEVRPRRPCARPARAPGPGSGPWRAAGRACRGASRSHRCRGCRSGSRSRISA